jgi:hypothetical protein
MWIPLVLALLSVAAAPAWAGGTVRTAERVLALKLGEPVRLTLRAEESHASRVSLASGSYLNVSVAPEGIGVLAILKSPHGETLFTERIPAGSDPYSIE